MQCSNNLKQDGLAVHNYESTYGYLPPGNGIDNSSMLSVILPYMEQANLYNLFDFTTNINNSPSNLKARTQEVKIYLCPSDPSSATLAEVGSPPSGLPTGRSNYLGNFGTTADPQSSEGNRVGVFNYKYSGTTLINKVTIVGISDGASNTAMLSETLRATNTTDPYDIGNVYLLPVGDGGWNMYTPMFGPQDGPIGANVPAFGLVQGTNSYRCNAWKYPPTNRVGYRGLQYYRGIPNLNQYTHTVPPNYKGFDCGDTGIAYAHVAARSKHSGGVNVCYADGSVHFVRESIDFATWQAMGTRAGGEVISNLP